jgi:hypothetical protein
MVSIAPILVKKASAVWPENNSILILQRYSGASHRTTGRKDYAASSHFDGVKI